MVTNTGHVLPRLRWAAAPLAALLLLAGCQAAPETGQVGQVDTEAPAEQPTTDEESSATHTESGFPRSEIDAVQGQFDNLAPSIVKIGDDFSYGTGWVLSENYVLTNWHVVDYMSGPISIQTFDGDTIFGSVIATEEFDDIAVIRLDQPTSLPPLSLSQAPVEEGEPVFFVGHPGAMGDWMIGVGIVGSQDEFFPEFIRTTLPADPGASGSPMFNMAGEVVALISGCMGSIDESRPIGDGSTVHSVIPGPPVADNCGGTEINRVKDFADQAIAAQ